MGYSVMAILLTGAMMRPPARRLPPSEILHRVSLVEAAADWLDGRAWAEYPGHDRMIAKRRRAAGGVEGASIDDRRRIAEADGIAG
jgi:hypothetical protein